MNASATSRGWFIRLLTALAFYAAGEAAALPADAFLVTSQAPRATRVAGTVVRDTARVSGEALQIVRLPVGLAGAALGILPGIPMTGGSNIARGVAAPFRTAGAVLQVPGHIIGAL